jgi:hypothetical protein
MAIVYTKKDQGKIITTGNGVPSHSAIAGDEYTDTTSGIHYIYTTSWVALSTGTGILTYFIETGNTVSPNTTVPIVALIASSGSTNVDFALIPKGTGALIAAIPDGTGTGGAKRGQYAVDLQLTRAYFERVASGNYSVALGRENTASATDAITIGNNGNATNSQAIVIGTGTASGSGSAVFGFGTASNLQAFSVGYQSNASGQESMALGHYNACSNSYSYALGRENTSSGVVSVAIGQSNIANTSRATAIGHTNTSSGSFSVAIGQTNTASGLNSTAVGQNNISSGQGSLAVNILNTASGGFSFAGGNGSLASGAYGFAFGYYTTAGGAYSYAIGRSASATNESYAFGWDVNASGQYSTSLGASTVASGKHSTSMGHLSSTFSVQGRQSYASGAEAVVGDSQASKFILRNRTTDATATTITTDSGAAGAFNQVILSNQSAYRFKGTIIAKVSGTTGVSAWDIDGLIVRGANAASTTLLVGNVNVVYDAIVVDGPPTLAADTTNGGLRVQVTGLLANIQWVATIETTEVIYA